MISKSFVQKTLKKHFPKLGDALIKCTYHHFSFAPNYDASDATISDDEIGSGTSVKVVFADFNFTKNQSGFLETAASILDRDKKGIMLTSEIDFKPHKDDKIYNSDDKVTYFVVGKNVDPYRGVYLFHLRPIEDYDG